jgi:hypothetical protein
MEMSGYLHALDALPQNRFGRYGEQKKCILLLRLESRLLDHPADLAVRLPLQHCSLRLNSAYGYNFRQQICRLVGLISSSIHIN